jgi:hypothetical protein
MELLALKSKVRNLKIDISQTNYSIKTLVNKLLVYNKSAKLF